MFSKAPTDSDVVVEMVSLDVRMKQLRKLIFERGFSYLLYFILFHLIEELLLEVNDWNSERIEKDSQFLVISGTQRTLERVRGMAVVVRIDVPMCVITN